VLATLTISNWIGFVVTVISLIVLLVTIIWGIREFVIDFNLYKFKKAYSRGDADRMEKAVGKILKIRPDDLYGLACKCLVYDMKGQYNKAKETGNKLLELANKKKKDEWQAFALNFLGVFNMEHGDFKKAEEMVEEALRISEKSNNNNQMSSSYSNLGLIYSRQGKLENAEEMYEKAIKVFPKKGFKELANTLCNFGINYRLQGDLVKADQMFNRALEINEKYSILSQLAANYAEIATVCVLKGEMERGQELYEKSLAISEPKGMIKLTANQYCNLGLLYKTMGNKEKAKEYWVKAKDLFEKMELTSEVERIQQQIDDSKLEWN
jgi:tetratricopeptide (TPR) repeat protein